jgi:hypothetical protein
MTCNAVKNKTGARVKYAAITRHECVVESGPPERAMVMNSVKPTVTDYFNGNLVRFLLQSIHSEFAG